MTPHSTIFCALLILLPQYLSAMTWSLYRNAPHCCNYPVTTPAPVKCVPCPPPTTLAPPVKVGPNIEPCCGPKDSKLCHTPCIPVYPLKPTTTPAPPLYTPSPCLPPTCYIDPVKQKAELEKIYKQGSQLMVDYSDAATGPVVYVAQTISNGADLIPSLFSAGGDFLGKAIASPIQFFNRIGFSLLSGAISQVVTIPISLGTSVRASTVVLQPYLRWFGLGGKDAPHTCCPTPPTPGTFEQIGLKPIGVLTGPIHFALGSFLNLGGSTFRLIGTMTKSGGEFFENTGHGFKNVGALKVADGINSIASFLSKIGNSDSKTICIDDGKKVSFYEEVKPVKMPEPYPSTTPPYSKPEVTFKPVLKLSTTPYPTQAPTTVKGIPSYTQSSPPPKTTTTTTTPAYEITTVKVVVDKKPEPVYPLPVMEEVPTESYDSEPILPSTDNEEED